MSESIDIVFSFDTTGSMSACISQVRRNVASTVERLFRDIPGLRVGVIAHGDYCDGPRAITVMDLSADKRQIVEFINKVPSTHGGDAPECYELALNVARTLSWSAGKNKAVVLIGDEVPHPPTYPENKKRLDWENEARLLTEAGIHVHAVQALARGHATSFYRKLAAVTGGCHLQLDQFSHVTDLLLAICYRQQGPEQVQRYVDEVQRRGTGVDRAIVESFSTLTGKRYAPAVEKFGSKPSLMAVPPGRFQVLDVDSDCSISDYVRSNDLKFKVGRGFYEFTKPVKVQDHKEVVLMDRTTGDMFSGTEARRMLKLPDSGTVSVRPDVAREVLRDYVAFVQSTSTNRKLLGGTKFLYEIEEWTR